MTILILICSFTLLKLLGQGSVRAAKNEQFSTKPSIYHMFDLSIADQILHILLGTLLFFNANIFYEDDTK